MYQKKRVSFSDLDGKSNVTPTNSFDAVTTNIIRFKHSDKKPSYTFKSDRLIESPSDVYLNFFHNVCRKSILKKAARSHQMMNSEHDDTQLISHTVTINDRMKMPEIPRSPLQNVSQFSTYVRIIP